PGIILLNGFHSTMRKSLKSRRLHSFCRTRGIPFLTFDHEAHGESSGTFELFTIGRGREDVAAFLDSVADPTRRHVLVGSSIGLWFALLAARDRPDRVAGIVGLGGAVNFTKRVLESMPAAERERYASWAASRGQTDEDVVEGEAWTRRSAYFEGGMKYGWRMLLDGPNHNIVAPWDVGGVPVELLHGKDDADVSIDIAWYLGKAVRSTVSLRLIAGAEHRLSRETDLVELEAAVDRVL
ncbi:Alpha/Beta hydrolase protein, partial [Blyttiomyces helicus]